MREEKILASLNLSEDTLKITIKRIVTKALYKGGKLETIGGRRHL